MYPPELKGKRERERGKCQGCWWAAERFLKDAFWVVEQLKRLSRCSRIKQLELDKNLEKGASTLSIKSAVGTHIEKSSSVNLYPNALWSGGFKKSSNVEPRHVWNSEGFLAARGERNLATAKSVERRHFNLIADQLALSPSAWNAKCWRELLPVYHLPH